MEDMSSGSGEAAFNESDIVIVSDASLGKVVKRLTRRKVQVEKGVFGVPLDYSQLSGSFVQLLRIVWKSLQALGTVDMTGFTVPDTFAFDAQESSTSLRINIQGVSKLSFDTKYTLTPPKAYNYLQNPSAAAGTAVPIVPGMTLTIFRLVRDAKAPAASKFILIEKSKTGEEVVTPKPFSIIMGNEALPSPMYMDSERIQDLINQGGASVPMLFPRAAIATTGASITDSLIRTQGGAYMLILDQTRLQWVVSLKFSPLFADTPAPATGVTLPPTRRSGPPPPTDQPAPPVITRPTAPQVAPSLPVATRPAAAAAPTAAGLTLEQQLQRAVKKTAVEGSGSQAGAIHSAVRWDLKAPNVKAPMTVLADEDRIELRSYKVDRFPATQYLYETEGPSTFTAPTNAEKLVLVQMAHALVTFAHETATILYFADMNIHGDKLRALAFRVDKNALSMDHALLQNDPGLQVLETNASNFGTAVACIMTATYLNHLGKGFIKTNQLSDRVLHTWLVTPLDVGAFGSFPPQHFTSKPSGDVRSMFTLSVDTIVNSFSICKYLMARAAGDERNVSALLTRSIILARALVTIILKTVAEDEHGEVSNMPALLHISIAMLLAEGVYFLNESSKTTDFINDTILRALTASTNDELNTLVTQFKITWPKD